MEGSCNFSKYHPSTFAYRATDDAPWTRRHFAKQFFSTRQMQQQNKLRWIVKHREFIKAENHLKRFDQRFVFDATNKGTTWFNFLFS